MIFDDTIPGDLADFADPRARRVVYADEGRIYVVERARAGSSGSGAAHRLRVPESATVVGLRWEDADHVLVEVTDPTVPDGAIVRCDVDTTDCELSVVLHGPHLLAR